MPDATADRPGRNDPCHCGSGNKYKRCCLAKDDAVERDAQSEAGAEAAASPAEENTKPDAAKPQRPTEQPWKRGSHKQAFQRFLTPRRRGGS